MTKRASNPAYFPNSVHRAKRYMKCLLLKVFKVKKRLVMATSPNSNNSKSLNPLASTSEEEYWLHYILKLFFFV